MKTVAKRNLVSLGIMEGYFFSRKIFLKILLSDRQPYYFRVLGIYGRKIFLYTPNFRIFVSLVKWEKFFRKNLVKYPNKSVVTFQYK